MRRTVLALGLLAILTPAAAAKGGSWLYPLEDRYEPGEVATLDGWTSPGQLGWVEDGPFLAYLRVDPIAVAMTPSVGWPSIDPTDLALGPLRLSTRAGHVVAVSITFRVPSDLAPGRYDVVYCNDPCTTGLGDLIGGYLYVAMDPPTPIPRDALPFAPAGKRWLKPQAG